MTVFEAYITNLGKYAEGQLVGETLKFPAITEEVQSLLKNIGVDGVLYAEIHRPRRHRAQRSRRSASVSLSEKMPSCELQTTFSRMHSVFSQKTARNKSV